jgi:heptosyltransferase II
LRILFVKLGAIGDVVQAAVAVKHYRSHSPEVHVDWVIGHRLRSLVEAFGVADNVISVDDDGLYAGSPLARLRSLVRCCLRLAGWKRYDRIITAYRDWRYQLLTLGIRTASREDFRPQPARRGLIQQRSRVHEYWRILSDGDSESLDIAEATRSLGSGTLNVPDVDTVFSLPERFIAVAPGGAKNQLREDALRRWPIERYHALIGNLLDEGHCVVLVGGPTDTWASDALRDLPVTDLIAKTSLLELLGVLRRSEILIGNDSGILHLGALTQTGIVALFGPTPANAFVPLGRPRTLALAAGNAVSCSPCYDGRGYADCRRNICMEAISVTTVIDAVHRVSSIQAFNRECLRVP